MKLSTNFSLSEFTRTSHTSVDNTPNQIQISNMQALCDNVLEPLRKHFGPVTVSSGFRSSELNKIVGGAPTSQHLTGQAADIRIAGVRNDEIWNFIVDRLQYDQCIAERLSPENGDSGWIHVSYCAHKNRREALSSPIPGKYVKGLVYK